MGLFSRTQCYLKYRLGIHATKLEIDGKFHVRSISALQVSLPQNQWYRPTEQMSTQEKTLLRGGVHTQVLLAQNEWYRPTEQMSTQGPGLVHQSRVKMYTFQLHRWFCALQVSFSFFESFFLPFFFFFFLFRFF